MESYSSFSTENETMDIAADLIWDQAILNFSLTDNEILLPLDIASLIGSSNVERLKSQLTVFLGHPCVAFVDGFLGCVRILARPEFKGLRSAIDNIIIPNMSSEEPTMMDIGQTKCFEEIDSKVEKRVKVPRPPNAFILYRKHYHAIFKARNPSMHNNEISVRVGAQWNSESAEVKAHYKALADEAKRVHAQKYPNYQYAPRKPCEKKRRSSRRASDSSDLDTLTEDEEENTLPTPGQSPANLQSITEFREPDQSQFQQQTFNNLSTIIPFASPLVETYRVEEFDAIEYNAWMNNANIAQRVAAINHNQARNSVNRVAHPISR